MRLTTTQGGSSESYTYDPAGNITDASTATGATSFSVNELNQIESANSTNYTYNADGELVDDGTNTYSWDAAGHLIEITNKQSGHTSQFTYDGFGRRISDTETDPSATPVTTRFLWCGLHLCEKRDASDAVLARYYPQGELQAGQVLFYAQDQIGSVTAVVDTSGQVVGRLSYDSYGNITSSSGTLPDFRYAGLYYHQATGLDLATYRAYNPTARRWITRDPIRENGGLNLYAYVDGSPIVGTDILGLDWIYGQSNGQLSDQPPASQGGGPPQPIERGYSGNGTDMDSHAMQSVKFHGPIPQGLWTIGPQEMHYSIGKNGEIHKLAKSMALTPEPGTNTFGRDDFLIHGDTPCECHNASDGCIVLSLPTRTKIANSGDHVLRVIP